MGAVEEHPKYRVAGGGVFTEWPPEAAVKLTESRRMRPGASGWGTLTDYTLESVKVRRWARGIVDSVAVLRLADRAGRVSCAVRGREVALLFGLALVDWAAVEDLTRSATELFYRKFQGGLRDDFPIEQRMFYYFCMTHQVKDLLFVKFRRAVTMRPCDHNGAFLDIFEVHKSNAQLMDLYQKTFPPNSYPNSFTESTPTDCSILKDTNNVKA